MSKSKLLEEGNPISSRTHDVVVSSPSLEAKCKSSLERNQYSISSRQLVLDDHMMENLLGADYALDDIREAIVVQ
jgi:hypothetical protein